ncbi:MAG: hypothetical protein S4CHLAM123_01000 [Chlamydiales bacterium]|nr:hypothetical protein [Chlamydiales bacterium]
MTNEASVTLLQAIAAEPPPFLREKVPSQEDSDSIWVAGYWDYSFELNNFVWCSGSWRRPPPGHSWIEGYWTRLDEGWVRVRGFWSKVAVSELTYIPLPPPNQLNENPSSRPGKKYFWMSGYWKYEKSKYVWYSGKWEKADADWIYSPARYIWRPNGYVFVPAFWDYPLDERGKAYPCVLVPKNQRDITYTPEMALDPMQIIEECLIYYPDYYYFYFHCYCFHNEWWFGCDWCPPWWAWDWWWFSWYDQWAIWWWWTHPGFPAPIWLLSDMIDLLFGPPEPLIQAIKSLHPPLIIGPDGMATPEDLIRENGDDAPVFPQDPGNVQQEAIKEAGQGSTDRPSAPHESFEELQKKPEPQPEMKPTPPSSAKPGEQPSLPSEPPRTVQPPLKPTKPIRPKPPARPQVQPHTHTPQPSYPSQPQQQPRYPSQPQQQQPSYQPRPYYPSRPQPQRPPRRPRPHYPSRPQGQPSQPNYPSRPQGRYPQPSQPNYPSRPQGRYPQPSRPSRPSAPQIQPYQPSTPQYTPRGTQSEMY